MTLKTINNIVGGLTTFPFGEIVTNYLQEKNLQNNLAFLIISSKNIAQISCNSFLTESTYFHPFPFFYLITFARGIQTTHALMR